MVTGPPKPTEMGDDSSTVPDKACLPMEGPVQTAVYAGTGWSAVRQQQLNPVPGTPPPSGPVFQGVVLISSAHDAGAFFTASAQRWPACSNRQFTDSNPNYGNMVHTVGPVSNTNGTLSATPTVARTRATLFCPRALTVANNVVIDVTACSPNQSDFAVNIAHQIAAKVPT